MFQSMLERRTHVGFFIVAAVLLVYIPLMFHLLNFPSVFPVYGDGQYYVSLADNLLYHGVFSDSLEAPFVPATFIMPIYPFLLAVFKAFFGSYMLFPIIQMILAGATAFFIFKIGERVFSERVGLVAAILFLLDPTTIFHSLIIMTDITYVFFIVLSVYLLFFSSEEDIPTRTFFSGLMFGAAMLIRVVSMFLPFLIIPMYFFVKRKHMPMKKIAIHLLIFAIAYSAVVIPWMARNKIASGVWGIAGEKSLNLFQYYVPEFLSFSRGISADDGRNILMSDLTREVGPVKPQDVGSLKYAPFEQKIALKYVKQDIFGYAKFHLIKMVPFFLSSQIKNSMVFYNNALAYEAYRTNTGNLTNLLSKGRVGEFFKELSVQPLVTFEQFLWFCLFVLMLMGIVFSDKDNRPYVFAFTALILYFAALTGPMAYSRFRLPAAPFIFLLASFGASVAYKAGRNFLNRKKVT
ncbi:MAG: glycosyltransferase family 39 protein [bacterium]|nr:glycosyltransferase family 39 protein [bacterium]